MELLLQVLPATMDHSSSYPTVLIVLASLLALFLFSRHRKSRLVLPPSPPVKLPLIGHMHHLASNPLPHRALRDLAQKHGPAIMHLQLGQVQTIVVSSAQMAEAILKTHDVNFAQRPPVHSANILAYGCTDIVFAPYGDYWRQLRRICTIELFSAKMIKSFGSIREDEVSKLVAAVSAASSSAAGVDLTAMFCKLTYSILSRAAFGEVGESSSSSSEAFLPLIDEITRVASGFNIADLYPSFKFLQVLTGVASKLNVLHEKADKVLESIIADHRARIGHTTRPGEEAEEETAADLLDVLLKHHEGEGNMGFSLTTDNIKAVLVDLFFAGTETTATSLDWIMSELVKNPRVMQKTQSEVRRVFGPQGKVDEPRLQELTYLKMVIRESMRLHPPVAVLLPRTGVEDCEIGGYHIPAGSSIMVNAWAIGRNPEYWTDAETFWPERFLESSVDYKGAHFQLLPFGAGRRICPGMSFALANLKLPLARLLYHFDWKLPNGQEDERVDMTETFGATVKRKTKLFLVPTVASSPDGK